jgi:trimethylguanosine synthase
MNEKLANKHSSSATANAATTANQETEQEDQELAALRELGLPSSFGVSQNASTYEYLQNINSHSSSQPRAQGAAWSDQPAPLENLFKSTPAQQWQQAIDPGTGHYYYYNETLQQTQWEPPIEGFTPAPTPDHSTAWWLPPDAALENQQQTASYMEGVSTLENTEKSPYNEAVDSYKEHHGYGLDTHDYANDDDRQIEKVEENEVKEKPTARVETTGLLPHILPPDPGQHTTFGSSSDSSSASGSEDTNLEEELIDEPLLPTSTPATTAATTVENKQSARSRRGKQRQRKVLDQYGEIVLPPCLHKYWLQRYSFFSKYDQGILIDEEGWYSVTPEVIAWHHAKRMVASMMGSKTCLAVDAFGGMGGNAIQLALAGCHVIAIEMDPSKASLIRQNTAVYGVEHLVEVICGDFLQVAPRIRADVVVLSPPWGGPEYSQKEKFDVENMGGNPELGLSKLLELSFGVMGCSSALVWLPKSSSLVQIEEAAVALARDDRAGDSSLCEAEIATLNGVTKAMTVYFGAAAKFRGQKQ